LFVLVCELLLLCLLGYASRKFHAVDGSFASSLSSLMIDIVIPCYVLKAMLETDDLMQLLRDGLNACLAALAVMAVLFVLGSLVKRLTGGGIGRIMRFGTMFSNALIFGMPIAETYWGTPGLICLMAFYTPIRFGYYGLSELLLSPEETSGKGHWKHALHILYSPAVLAFVIGPILLAMNVQLPEVVIRILDDVGACCKPLGMMLVGKVHQQSGEGHQHHGEKKIKHRMENRDSKRCDRLLDEGKPENAVENEKRRQKNCRRDEIGKQMNARHAPRVDVGANAGDY